MARDLLDFEHEPLPLEKPVIIEVDHRIPSREIERMLLERFNVSKNMKPEVKAVAMDISKYAATYFLDLRELFGMEAAGSS